MVRDESDVMMCVVWVESDEIEWVERDCADTVA